MKWVVRNDTWDEHNGQAQYRTHKHWYEKQHGWVRNAENYIYTLPEILTLGWDLCCSLELALFGVPDVP